MVHNEPRPTLPGEVCPDPLNKHAYAKARLREELEMNSCPREPGSEARHLKSPTLEDRKAFSNHSHVSLIEIPERRKRRLAGDLSMNHLSGMSSLLDRDLRYSG